MISRSLHREVRVEPIVHKDVAADGRLAALGLAAEDFAFVLSGADAEARMWSSLAPPIMAGMARWGKTNELMRVRLLPRGWSHDNPRNLPRTISPGREFAIVGTTGDGATGLAAGHPTTRYAKGVETARAVERNGQLAFDYVDMEIGEALSAVAGSEDALATWLLLYNVTGRQIRAELSLPESISPRGYVNAWTERIMLPAIQLGDPEVSGRAARGDDGITVAVERR
jgi:hypothetical protein